MKKLSASVLVCAAQVLSMIIGVGAQQVAPWEEKMLRENCSDGPNLSSLEDRADRHIAAHDSIDAIDPLLKKASRMALACSKSTADPHAKDWYLFSYANDLFRSVSSPGEAKSSWPAATKVLRDLSANSKYSDVKSAARQSLDLAKQAEEQAGVH